MKTINYTFSVWVTTILLSPIIFLIYMFFFHKNSWYVHFDENIFSTYGAIVFSSCIMLFLSWLIFLLMAGYLSIRDDFGIYTRKTILFCVTLLGLIPIFYFLDIEKILFLLSIPWWLVGTFSTFLYDWQPEND